MRRVLTVWLLGICACLGVAQSAQQLLSEGKALEAKFNVKGALAKYEAALRTDSQMAEAWWRASRMLSNEGGRLAQTEADLKRLKYEQARAYALRAVALNPAEPEARLAHIIALGLLAEVAGNPREKIRNAKIIREEAEAILVLDSAFAPAYFVLGKWHFELARLNWMEQMAVAIFFGGMPENVSMEKAGRLMEKANRLAPDAILYLYGEASVLQYRGKKTEAVAVLNRALSLPPREPDDVLRKEMCRDLLRGIR
jgi:tetratricopeptide (TPR) repeat protein